MTGIPGVPATSKMTSEVRTLSPGKLLVTIGDVWRNEFAYVGLEKVKEFFLKNLQRVLQSKLRNSEMEGFEEFC